MSTLLVAFKGGLLKGSLRGDRYTDTGQAQINSTHFLIAVKITAGCHPVHFPRVSSSASNTRPALRLFVFSLITVRTDSSITDTELGEVFNKNYATTSSFSF